MARLKTSAFDREFEQINNTSEKTGLLVKHLEAIKTTELYNSSRPSFDFDIHSLIDWPNNEFSLIGIEDMAQSIEDYGQLQEIIVIQKEDNKFMIVVGHRRTYAIRSIYDKYNALYSSTGNKAFLAKRDLYSTIRGRILESHEIDLAEAIYLESNYEHRQNTFILALNHIPHLLKKLNGEDVEYLKRLYGEDNVPSKINYSKAIYKILSEKLRVSDMSETTITRYLAILNKAHPNLINAVRSGAITVTTAWELSRKFSIENQALLVDAYGSDDYDNLLKSLLSKKVAKSEKSAFSKTKISAFEKSFLSKIKDQEKVTKAKSIFNELRLLLSEE